ncbi:acid-sensing ion channel 2 isoform X2 [Nematostella vectensis]|uniref:acid-sensing ion channel 2 isoform X2 n=1 Tax=Nematostella vectensis TaxID=45351 RepID=UPI0020772449|nr:acid-sensing ion channel 2 isoform X2 [Nematostella vectensis]
MNLFQTKVKPLSRDEAKSDSEKEIEEQRKTLIKNFSSYTTLHGFHFLLDSSPMPRRVLWTALVVFGLVFFFIQLVMSYGKLRARESILAKGVERPMNVLYPAVTICNQNMMRKSKITGTAAQRYLDQLDHIKASLSRVNRTNERFETEEMVRLYGHNITDMLWECNFMNKPCSHKDFAMRYTSYSRGLCYTFNSGANGSPIGQATTSGTRTSLSLRLNAESDEYYGPFSYDATGFKLAVHDQNEIPNMDEDAFDISPGFLTNIRIRREKEINLPSPYRSECGSRDLSNAPKYSMSGCIYECYSKIIADKCKCRVLGMALNGLNVTQFCTSDEIINCVSTTYQLNPAMCDCPKPCRALHYKIQLSLAYFPSDHLWDSIFPVLLNFTELVKVNTTGKSQDEVLLQIQEALRKQIAQVQIYYETLLTDVLEEKPAYGISEFGSDVGGNMGLFLGCSLLTFCEFIDLVFMLCLHRHRLRKEAKERQARAAIQDD